MKKVQCEVCQVRGMCCLSDIPNDQLETFRACSMSAVYKPRQVVFHEGTPAEGLYFLCHGAVKLYQSGRFGNDHILAIGGPGDVLGELPVRSGATYSTSAEALVESQVCYLARDKIERMIQTHPMVGVRLLASLSTALIAARAKVRDMVLKPAEVRLAELLAHLSSVAEGHGDGTHLGLAYSRRDIAQMIGVSTETAIRLLAKLKKRGMLATNGRELVITDVTRLRRLASQASPL